MFREFGRGLESEERPTAEAITRATDTEPTAIHFRVRDAVASVDNPGSVEQIRLLRAFPSACVA
jgi:hypothetical protein